MAAIPWLIMLGACIVAAWNEPGAALLAAGYFGLLAFVIGALFWRKL